MRERSHRMYGPEASARGGVEWRLEQSKAAHADTGERCGREGGACQMSGEPGGRVREGRGSEGGRETLVLPWYVSVRLTLLLLLLPLLSPLFLGTARRPSSGTRTGTRERPRRSKSWPRTTLRTCRRATSCSATRRSGTSTTRARTCKRLTTPAAAWVAAAATTDKWTRPTFSGALCACGVNACV